MVEPADGRIPPITAEAQRRGRCGRRSAAIAPSSWADRSLYDRCITRGVIGSILPVIYGNGNISSSRPDVVVDQLRDGARHAHHPARRAPARRVEDPDQYLGDARGHWEGNTLVVETTNFLGNTTGIGGNGGGRADERRASRDRTVHACRADVLNYEVSITDPKTYSGR